MTNQIVIILHFNDNTQLIKSMSEKHNRLKVNLFEI